MSFAVCLPVILASEGGWSDNPADPGGATMKGITLATYQRYVPDATADDLRNIPDDEVELIYEDGYWKPIDGDSLPDGVDLVTFDFAVNAGPRRAATMLQQAVGVAADGVIGPITLAAVQRAPAPTTIDAYHDLRDAYYRSLANFPTFGVGWLARNDKTRDIALTMVLP